MMDKVGVTVVRAVFNMIFPAANSPGFWEVQENE